MKKFNLLDENWIRVIVDKKGNVEEISLLTLFDNANSYYGFAGETKTQDFAIMRLILAILHTVFSRFDSDGNEYGYFELDDKFRQVKNIEDEDEIEEYIEALLETWKDIWKSKKFPDIIKKYLEKWRNHFYLFDYEFPFYQVLEEDIAADKINKAAATEISGKNINRLITESNNKIALFSPKYGADKNKEKLTPAEIARWTITYQNYTGLADKVIFGSEKYKSSKGWLFDIGGIALKTDSLFDTLLLNCVIVHPEKKYWKYMQRPCWEFNSKEILKRSFSNYEVNNLAELYTSWSRAVHIDPELDLKKPFSFKIVKMPDIDHRNQFLEIMTIWKHNENGENKGFYTPRKHRINQSLWRNFGMLTLSYDALFDSKAQVSHKPGIIEWLAILNKILGERRISIEAISMQDDGNATSWLPVDEVYDSLSLYDKLLVDADDDGWVYIINDIVEKTKKVVEKIFKNFIREISEIRNLSDKNSFISEYIERLYFNVDYKFKTWLSEINPEDSKERKILEWEEELRNLTISSAEDIIRSAGNRDYKGIIVETKKGNTLKNIATIHNSFIFYLNKELPVKEL